MMVAAKSRRAPGRRERLLAAAAELFFEQGYAATSIDAIIERAGGSKRNIYNEFGNKEGLFAAIVSTSAEKALSSLVIDEIEGRHLRDILMAFGHQLMTIYMSPALIGIYRTIVAEASRYPDLGQKFYQSGPDRATNRLAEVLEVANARGEIHTDDCIRTAGHFVALIRDNVHLQVVLALRPAPDEKEMQEAVLSAVNLFLNGVEPR